MGHPCVMTGYQLNWCRRRTQTTHAFAGRPRTSCGADGARRRRGEAMTLTTVRQLLLLYLLWLCGTWSPTGASPLNQWDHGRMFRKVRDVHSGDLSDVLWGDQNEEQVQNVFKRFLFHYSKAHNSVGAVQHESDSVHPLMRLSPKLSQRNRKVVLLKIRGLPEGML